MMAPLDRDRLAKLLGMLGSDHDGEIVSAGRHADALVRRAGLTWHDIVLVAAQTQTDRIDEIDFCLRHAARLTQWEAKFVRSLRAVAYPLTERQRSVLAGIVDKLRDRAEAA